MNSALFPFTGNDLHPLPVKRAFPPHPSPPARAHPGSLSHTKKTARSLPERAVWTGLAVCRAVVAVFSEQVIVRADVLVMAVFHAEAAGDDAELHEAEAFVEMPRVGVGGDDGVELQDAKAQPFALHE